MPAEVTYVVRRHGKDEFRGTLEELRSWLAQRRVTGEDEVRRLGYVVLEGDDLWTRVGDRKELGFDITKERNRLRQLKTAAKTTLWASALVLLFVCILLGVNQGIPRFEEQVGIMKAQQESAGLRAKIEDLESSLKEKSAELTSLQQLSDVQLDKLRKDKDLAASEALKLKQTMEAERASRQEALSQTSERGKNVLDFARQRDLVGQVKILNARLVDLGYKTVISDDGKQITLSANGARLVLQGDASKGLHLHYLVEFPRKEGDAKFLTEAMLKIFELEHNMQWGKVLFGDGTFVYVSSTVLAPQTPSVIVEDFLFVSGMTSNLYRSSLDDFLLK